MKGKWTDNPDGSMTYEITVPLVQVGHLPTFFNIPIVCDTTMCDLGEAFLIAPDGTPHRILGPEPPKETE